jgi:hypothetical protein
MPEHVEKMESGGLMCRHCGGAVDADGYSTGGEAVDDAAETLLDDNDDESESTAQRDSTMHIRRLGGFADAMSRRGRG